jgi:hypothetical protein
VPRSLIVSLSVVVGLGAGVAVLASVPPRILQALEGQAAVVRAEPGNAGAHNDYANLLALAGELGAAERAYVRALELDPAMVSARYNLAILYLQRGDLKAAATGFQQVLDLAPENAWAWYQLGAVRERQGRTRAAVSAYAHAFRLDPLLSFDDVNPQVIDSKLTTRALLRLSSRHDGAEEAPLRYEQPAHVAGLLLPPRPNDEPAEPPAGAAAPAPALRPQAGEVATAEGRAPEVKVLTLEDLQPGSRVGEATPPAGGGLTGGTAGPRGRVRPQTGGTYRPPATRGQEPGGGIGTPSTGRVQIKRDDG